MVKNIKILFIILGNIFLVGLAEAQTTDTIDCDRYFDELDKKEALMTLWSSPPLLKETNTFILCEICDLFANDSFQIATILILDKEGIPICAKIYPEIIRYSLKNEIVKLLYKLEFEPAIANESPVMSDFMLFFNTQRCEMYKNKNIQKKRRRHFIYKLPRKW